MPNTLRKHRYTVTAEADYNERRAGNKQWVDSGMPYSNQGDNFDN